MLTKLIFLILVKNVLTDITNTNEPKTNSNSKHPTQISKKVRAEFIEEVNDQTYLPYLHEDDVYTLDLNNFLDTLKSTGFGDDAEAKLVCPKKIFENFKMKGLHSPLTVSSPITECPTMKNSCCGEGDLVLLREAWDLRFNRYLKFNQYYFKYYVLTILKNHEAIKRMAQTVSEFAKDRHCAKISEKLLAFKINDDYIKKASELINSFLDYDQKVKHSFICFLCDYESFRYWDIDCQTVAFNYKFCDSIVENALDYYYMLNTEIYKYINTANFLTKCVNLEDPSLLGKMDTHAGKSTEFLEVDNSMYLHQCKLAKDKKYNIFNNCLNFCSKFNFWYPSRPMYRSAYQLAEIFSNLKEKIFRDDLIYNVSEPGSVNSLLPIFEVKYSDEDIFQNFDRVFIDRGGIKPETLLSAVHN